MATPACPKSLPAARVGDASMLGRVTAPHETHHDHYEHYDPTRIDRLEGLYGRVEAEMHRRLVLPNVVGRSVLDVGCGFGSTVEALRRAGFEATGVDTLPTWVEAGRRRFPGIDLRVAEPCAFALPDGSQDTVVLKEVMHHIADEGDPERFLAEVRRVCRRRLIVIDPNPNPLLLAARRLIGHVDPVCTAERAGALVEAAGFRVASLVYSEVLAFPLSGGYVSPFRVPDPPGLGRALVALDRTLARAARRLHLSRGVCWRYTLVADL
jgi:SAM-dependent methyltransferase